MDYVVLFVIIFIIVIFIIRSNATIKSTYNSDDIFTPIVIPPPVYETAPLFPDNKVYDDLSLASSNESCITDLKSKDTYIAPIGNGKDQYFIDYPKETEIFSIYNNPYKKDKKVSKCTKRYNKTK
jgi:hypothetical protein